MNADRRSGLPLARRGTDAQLDHVRGFGKAVRQHLRIGIMQLTVVRPQMVDLGRTTIDYDFQIARIGIEKGQSLMVE